MAQAVGALGTIVINSVPGVIAGSGDGAFGPVVSINPADGAAIVARLAAGETVEATLSVDINPVTTYNVIAETKGGDHDNVLMLGAHVS